MTFVKSVLLAVMGAARAVDVFVTTWRYSKKTRLNHWRLHDMKYGCCKNCSCASKKIKDPGCQCGNHEIKESE